MKIVRLICIALLLFLGFTACDGGITLIMDPTGNLMGMPLDWLQYSPFDNYLIPGLQLLITNGISAIVIAILAITKYRYYPQLIIIQGLVLFCWILVQFLMLRMYHPLHLMYGGIGIALMVLGENIRRRLAGE